eukprot:8064437-Pyramimonas_sp.AAC.1
MQAARHARDMHQDLESLLLPASGKLQGLICSDGSAAHPTCEFKRRAGWSLVQVNDQGDVLRAAFGPVPREVAPSQQARDGEDYAYRMAAELVDPSSDFEIFTDCSGTLGCVWDRARSCSSQNSRAHLWSFVWH